jgi:hypothetical protein
MRPVTATDPSQFCGVRPWARPCGRGTRPAPGPPFGGISGPGLPFAQRLRTALATGARWASARRLVSVPLAAPASALAWHER